MDCMHNGCGACCGGACAGCDGALALTETEVQLLRRFGEIPFLPVARAQDSAVPVFLEEDCCDLEESGSALLGLSRKGLITIDYHIPLSNYEYPGYGAYPIRGSMALTARGQAALDLLDIQGIEA